MATDKKLLLALQYWKGDYEHAMRLARRVASIEKKFRNDVEFLFVTRFDAPEPDRAAVASLSDKMKVSSYRTKRRGVGHPGGCNDMWHDLVGEMWRRTLQDKNFVGKFSGVFSFEADNVPLCEDWIDRVLSEWKEALEAGKSIWGCFMDAPVPHINGNMIWVPELYGKFRGLEGCASFYAWDMFHAPKWLNDSFHAQEIVNYYRATEVPKKKLYDAKNRAKYALVHGVKDDSAWEEALKKF